MDDRSISSLFLEYYSSTVFIYVELNYSIRKIINSAILDTADVPWTLHSPSVRYVCHNFSLFIPTVTVQSCDEWDILLQKFFIWLVTQLLQVQYPRLNHSSWLSDKDKWSTYSIEFLPYQSIRTYKLTWVGILNSEYPNKIYYNRIHILNPTVAN